MSNIDYNAAKGMTKLVLTALVIAVIMAVAYLAMFTPGG
ncbi:hypothetical protein RLPCCGM1_c0838 [Rhizobium leguminosarum bv. phaseoli CCGM1]|nr:hypothetical protein RLPCCGM1_c0838 [Rhizobium leguminosarum bv. phaseoli CCGM1]